jgi:hypothetical protein
MSRPASNRHAASPPGRAHAAVVRCRVPAPAHTHPPPPPARPPRLEAPAAGFATRPPAKPSAAPAAARPCTWTTTKAWMGTTLPGAATTEIHVDLRPLDIRSDTPSHPISSPHKDLDSIFHLLMQKPELGAGCQRPPLTPHRTARKGTTFPCTAMADPKQASTTTSPRGPPRHRPQAIRSAPLRCYIKMDEILWVKLTTWDSFNSMSPLCNAVASGFS